MFNKLIGNIIPGSGFYYLAIFQSYAEMYYFILADYNFKIWIWYQMSIKSHVTPSISLDSKF